MNGRSCAAVAGQLNVSPQAVSKLKGHALDHLLVWLVEEQGSSEESWEER